MALLLTVQDDSFGIFRRITDQRPSISMGSWKTSTCAQKSETALNVRHGQPLYIQPSEMFAPARSTRNFLRIQQIMRRSRSAIGEPPEQERP